MLYSSGIKSMRPDDYMDVSTRYLSVGSFHARTLVELSAGHTRVPCLYQRVDLLNALSQYLSRCHNATW
jgi:hypothetical protein